MGKTGKWLKNFLTGKKDNKEKENKNGVSNLHVSNDNGKDQQRPTTPISIPQPTTPKEKRRWSFRRSSATAPGRQESNSMENIVTPSSLMDHHVETDTKKHALAVAVATAAAADAAVAAAKAAACVIQLTAAASGRPNAVEEAAAVKIQSFFRGYLARKALNALKGLVKLQALVRGHLVRKQATATLKCMQALVTVQARARAQRLRMAEETKFTNQRQFNHRKSTQENYKYMNPNQDYDRGLEENIKIVEMDHGDYKPVIKARNSYSNHTQIDRSEHRISAHRTSLKQDNHQISPAPSAMTDISPRTCSNHFEEYSFGTAQSSPQCHSAISKPDPARIPFSYARSEFAESLYSEYPFYPNYMANTESSRAKVRSHSAPKQRPLETYERQPSRRRPSLEGRNVPRAVRMQRSSSHVGSTAQNYQYPWSVKLDKSTVSLKDSECGSTSTVLTNPNYCRSLVGFDVQGARY